MHRQTVHTQIRLLLKEKSVLGLQFSLSCQAFCEKRSEYRFLLLRFLVMMPTVALWMDTMETAFIFDINNPI